MTVNVSIIIPTLNEEHFLSILLNSIKHQTAQPTEVIVADAGSTDKTIEVARAHGCKVIKGGLAQVGRNNGVAVAKEDVILFLDADCILTRHFLERTVAEFERRNLDVASCYSSLAPASFMDKAGEGVMNTYYRITERFRPHVYGYCIFVRKELHNKIHGFDPGVFVGDDQDYVLRAGKKGKFGFLTSATINASIRRFAKEGKVKTALKNIYIEFHLIFKGSIRKKIFDYKFGDYSSKKS